MIKRLLSTTTTIRKRAGFLMITLHHTLFLTADLFVELRTSSLQGPMFYPTLCCAAIYILLYNEVGEYIFL